MTIPTLINNYQQKVLNYRFKKTYATINQALTNALNQFDYLPRCFYGLTIPGSADDCNLLGEKFYSSLNIIKYCQNNAYSNGCIPKYSGQDTVLKEIHKNDSDYDENYWQNHATTNCGGFDENEILNRKSARVISDGIILFNYRDSYPIIIIAADINGKQGPNKWGYDLFSFIIKSDGNNYKFYPGGCMTPEEGGVSTELMLKRVFGQN